MDPDERARRREERRRKREEESDAAETNGPSEETAEEQERRERRERRARERAELSNQTEEEDDDAERLRQEEEMKRRREEEEAARRRQEEEERAAEKQREEERRKKAAAEEKERKRNAEIERQRQEDLKKEEDAKQNAESQPKDAPPAEKPKKKLNLLGKVSKGRKKEILAMMLKKARGDLQLEEQEAALEKKKFIDEKVRDSNVDSLNKNQLMQLCEELHNQLQQAEGEKFDLEIKVKRRDLQISNLKVKANETRGRFTMPTLKTVSKTGSAKTKVTEKKDFRSDLKKAEQTAEN